MQVGENSVGATINGVEFRGNYDQHQGATYADIILNLVNGFDIENNFFNNSPGTVIQNATSGTSNIIWRNNGFNIVASSTAITSYSGFAESDDKGVVRFFNGVNLSTSVAGDGNGFKHKRLSTGSIAAASSSQVTLSWTTAFADASYTPSCLVVDSTTSTSTLRIHHAVSVSSSSVVLLVTNDDSAGAHAGTLDCIAAHD